MSSSLESGIDPAVRTLFYYHGLLPREEIDCFIRKPGDFLLRKVDTGGRGRAMALAVRAGDDSIKHLRIYLTDNLKYRVDDRAFDSIKDLVDWNKNNQTQLSGAVLRRPIPRQDWQLNHEQVKLYEKLGSGAFGDVWKGILIVDAVNTIEVAVKTLRPGTMSKQDRLAFLKEARLMRNYLHNNVVKVCGVASQEEPLMIIMEYCQAGSLHRFLRKNGLKIRVVHRVRFAMDAANGLAYLEREKCVHRDIAARNCLLNKVGDLKISDFGLSRESGALNNDKSNVRLPIKWMAPESLTAGIFTHKSDVWSYGVLLWEIFADAEEPYPGMTNAQTKEKVTKQKYRMTPPDGTPDKVVDIMVKCWNHDKPDRRPQFAELKKICKKIYDSFDLSLSGGLNFA